MILSLFFGFVVFRFVFLNKDEQPEMQVIKGVACKNSTGQEFGFRI